MTLSLYFDARSSLVYLCAEGQAIARLTLGEYRGLVGVEGVRWLLHGGAYVRA